MFDALGRDNILDYRQNSTGFNTFVSYPLKRSFARLSLSYGYQKTRLTTFSRSAENLFTFLNFEGVAGPNSLEGITTSEITPGIFYNTVNHPITPSAGKSLFANVAVAGFGGNTRFMQPTVEAKYFKKVSARGNVIGMRLLFRSSQDTVAECRRRSGDPSWEGKTTSAASRFFHRSHGVDPRYSVRPPSSMAMGRFGSRS